MKRKIIQTLFSLFVLTSSSLYIYSALKGLIPLNTFGLFVNTFLVIGSLYFLFSGEQ